MLKSMINPDLSGKKVLMSLVVMMILFTTAFATENWVGFTSSSAEVPQVTVVESDNSKLILDITIPGMKVYTIEEKGETFQRLELVKNHTTYDIGKPELPMINEIIGIPDNQKVKVRILEETTTTLENYNIYPFQTPTKDENPQEFVIDRSFYNSGATYPEQNIYFANPGIWRDVKITGFHFVPFKYSPSSKELEVTTNIKVQIEFYGLDDEYIFTKDKIVTPEFYKMYDFAIINFNSLGYTTDNTRDISIKYLIVTNISVLTEIQPFADWKNQQGCPVEVRTLETGFQTTQEIKDYITQLYNSDELEYVLLVGDAYPGGGTGPDNVPMYHWIDTYSDIWYVCMQGNNDFYADLAVGRITYDNPTELELQMQKLMDHYLTPDTSTNWGENSILVAHLQDYPLKYTLCKEQIRTFPYSIQTPIFTTCYGGAGATNNDIIDFVNNTSCGIFNYRGHGSETEFWQWGASGSFTNTHIQQFTNANRYFVLFDVCCSNMDIVGYNGNCLCESFMKSPVAAIAINGAIEPSYTIPNHDYDKEMYKAIFDQGINNIGYITNYANVYVVNNHPSYGPPNFRTYLWLGDSSLEPWTLQPADLIVSHDAQLFLGLSTFDVTVMGTGGPLENARVCVSNEDGTIYGIAFTDASGFAQVQFDEPVQTPGTAKVTVTSHNFLPYQQDIPVIPQSGPYVIYESFIINDSVGNNNGLMDYSESILLTLSVENVGIAVANNVTVTLSTTDLYVTITDSTEFYGDIPVGGIVTVNDGFAFDVANDIPDGHYVLFDVSATDGTDVWESSFSIEAHAPVLEFYEFLIDDTFSGNGDYMWDPGETVDIVVTLANNGSSDAFNVFGELTTSDPYVTLNTTGAQPYGDMIFGNTAEQSFNATSDENTPEAHMVEFIIDITADQGITGSGTFETQIGGYLIEEYFDSWLPAGWTTTGGTNWGSGSGNNAGGTPPEAQFSWSPSTTATQRLISLPVNTTGSATLELEFKHMVDHYGGTYQLRVETTSDGGSTWNIVQTWPAQNLSATIEELIIDNNDVGSSTFQVAWVFDGYSWNINYWYVDDVILGGGTSAIVGTIAGHVTLTGGSGNVQDVLVSAGGFSTNPYASGDYAFQVPPGTYDVTAELPGYIPQTVTGVVVEDGVTTSDIDFTLEALSAPTNLVCTIIDYNDVHLEWDQPVTSRQVSSSTKTLSTKLTTSDTKRMETQKTDDLRELLGYNVYRDTLIIQEITDPGVTTYDDLALAAGEYEYYVVALYDVGESEASNIETIVITLLPPQNPQAVTQQQDILITWDAPPQRALSHYKVYRNVVLIASNVEDTSYLDEDIPAGIYIYNIKAVYDGNYESEMSDDAIINHEPVNADGVLIPVKTELCGNYPNPFNPSGAGRSPETTISFSLKANSRVVLEIFNIRGQKVRKLVNDNLNAGFYNVVWNGKDDNNRNVASGIYFSTFDVKDEEGDFTSVKKMILLK